VNLIFSFRKILTILILSNICNLLSICTSYSSDKFNIDLQGDLHYSRYNFNDVSIPYDGFDSWMELKFAFYPYGKNIDNKENIFSYYLDMVPSWSSDSEFWWQKNIQFGIGAQLYPFKNILKSEGYLYSLLNGVRLYGVYLWRDYYDEPKNEEYKTNDIQAGADIYYDNIFTEDFITVVLWSNAGYRHTNFSMNNYDTFLWTGNLKVGKYFGEKIGFFPHVVTDWTYVPKFDERWYENFIRMGLGIQLYPVPNQEGKGIYSNFLKRLNIYVETLHNVAWLGDQPPNSVKDIDFRIGINFSTFYE